jgi:hypothetical protein
MGQVRALIRTETNVSDLIISDELFTAMMLFMV